MTHITHSSVDLLTFPLVAPFAVATRTAYEARNVLLRVYAGNGSVGLGAAAPVQYVTGETHDSALAALTDAAPSLEGMGVDRLRPLLALAGKLLPDQPAARAALEMALMDLWGKRWSIPLWQHFGGALTSLTADLTIPIVAPDEAARKAMAAWSAGFRHLKIKVGDPEGIESDYARLAAVAEAAPDAKLRIDANQAFTPDGAVEFVGKALVIARNIEMIEQPVAKEDFDGLSYVHDRIGDVPLFADESAQTVASAVRLIESGAVDGINVKLMKSGIAGAWEIASLCRASGIKLMVGCMLESQLPLTAAAALVAGTGWFDFVDLDSHHLLSPSNLFSGGFTHIGPEIAPEMERAGWGVECEI